MVFLEAALYIIKVVGSDDFFFYLICVFSDISLGNICQFKKDVIPLSP